MNLRPYQRQAIQAIREEWDEGKNNVLIVLATGLGKTVIFTTIGAELRREGMRRILVLAHRQELVQQALAKWEKVAPAENVGVYMGARKEVDADVICASVASCYPDRYSVDPCPTCGVRDEAGELGRGPGCSECTDGEVRRLVRRGRIHDLPLSEIDLIIVDEAHHITRESQYVSVIEAVREANPACLLLMVTATPFRQDRRGFGWLLDGVPFVMGIQAGIDQGWLAPFSEESVRVELNVDLSQVKVSKRTGDFVEEDLGAVLDNDDARREIVRAWEAAAGPEAPSAPEGGRPTVVFCPTVAFAEHLCEAFTEAGHPAGWICGDSKLCPKDERRRRLKAYAERKLRIMVNVGVLTEGWDDPGTSCIVIARPTQSRGLYAQMVGRGTRIVGREIEESRRNGKADCLVMDCVGASALGLMTRADLSEDPPPESIARELLGEEEDEEPPEVALDLDFPEEPQTVEVRGHTTYRIDLFSGRISWTRVAETRVACLSPGRAVVIFSAGVSPDGEPLFSACASGRNKPIEWIAERVPEAEGLKAGELYCLEHGSEQWLKPNTFVTRRPLSTSQSAALAKLLRWNEREAKRTGSSRPIPISREQIERLSMAEASAWAAYLEARLAFARASS